MDGQFKTLQKVIETIVSTGPIFTSVDLLANLEGVQKTEVDVALNSLVHEGILQKDQSFGKSTVYIRSKIGDEQDYFLVMSARYLVEMEKADENSIKNEAIEMAMRKYNNKES
ncbi:MAG TPA: hypothetical protein VFI61_03265 [Patescibacteria group bacterium]|nr:hypothetical protein [Patescibacteria group bacterium]